MLFPKSEYVSSFLLLLLFTKKKTCLIVFIREYESRCVQRKVLLETLADELPQGTIRFSSKVVHIELSGYYKMVHLSDGTILKTKVLVLLLCK